MTIAFAQSKGEAGSFSDINHFGVNSQEILNKVEIYPNPSVEFLIVEIKNSKLYSVQFEMRSIIGNKLNVIPENIGADKFRFNVKQFPPGYYFIVVKDDDSQFKEAHRFLKK